MCKTGYNAVQQLKKIGFDFINPIYLHNVRNGIAHGGVTYKHKEIKFQDKRGNSKTLADKQLIDLIDSSIDICNGIILASKVFYLTHLNNNFKPSTDFKSSLTNFSVILGTLGFSVTTVFFTCPKYPLGAVNLS